jgi:BirA family biotin operon repressor/biotin-[acetyl-CoA-carboxylase] ligase
MITAEIRLATIESTMDAAKAVADGQDFLLVTADEQTRGKGTRGRAWRSMPGNIYMTMGIHRRHLPPERLALLPLEIGLHVWDEAAARVAADNRKFLSLKWPNDLLYRESKVAGILMESHASFLLVGIGINVAGAPEITDGGGPSACLADGGMDPKDKDAFTDGLYRRIIDASKPQMQDSPGSGFDSGQLLLAWQGKVDWDRSHRLRDRDGQPWVQPVSVNTHGHLQVRHMDGSHEWLVADYLA